MEVMLFGMIAEKAGTEKLVIQASSLNELRAALIARIEGINDLSYAIAVDRLIVHDDLELKGTEEIAVLPPFAGG